MRGPNWRFHYLKKAYAPYPAPPGAGGRAVAADFMARYYQAFDKRRSPGRKLLDGLISLAFPIWSGWRARAIARRFGLGRDWARKAARIARARFTDPREIALYGIEREDEMDAYLRLFEHDALIRLIDPHGRDADTGLNDKRLFAEICARHDLPAPPLFAEATDGAVQVHAAPPQGRDICVKPSHSTGGIGVEIRRAGDIPSRDPDAFAAFLKQSFGVKTDWIAQARLINHPDMAAMTLDALSTARITTILNERDEPEIVSTLLRLPARAGQVVDNAKAGGLVVSIDADTGVLGVPVIGYAPGVLARHPQNDARIEGVRLPFWPEAKALALRAHRDAFAAFTMIGWDIAITADGPVLVEGNNKPGLIIAQRAAGAGLGRTRHGALIAHHIDRALDAQGR